MIFRKRLGILPILQNIINKTKFSEKELTCVINYIIVFFIIKMYKYTKPMKVAKAFILF
ncbi:hypothetical protein HNQ54_002036 [Anaerocolumna cellulosilytica]|nr:hypothetical protein [Anaerocolumna cellulosilytica]